ncbi:MAG TPA: branched-chain amino acid ABC transporter permease [Thermoanaerobacter sp.]|nr:branched-chain amino acid ABC transporter permease [Thermoanaerobacter sp.]
MLMQQLFTGLSIGGMYALMAVGYSLIYSLLNFTNFAHSIAVTAGAYTGFYMLSKVSPKLSIAVIAAILIGGVVSSIIELTSYNPLLNKGAKRIYLLIAGLGLSTIGQNIIIISIGGRFKAFPNASAMKLINVGGITMGSVDIIMIIVSVIALIFVELLMQKTKIGLAIRGAAFDLDVTSLMGVNVSQLILFVFMLAGSLAGLSGFFLGMKYTAYPALGDMTLKAFIASVLGGLGSIPGAVLGATVLGIMETLISAYISSSMRDIFSFAIMVFVLIIKPNGFMGKNVEDKA